jgi:hypothetical protein
MKSCWARILGNCSKKFSLEHYIGHDLLDNVRIRGLHPNLEGMELPSSVLQAHLLCETHNSELSETDTEAVNLHKIMSEWFKEDDIFAGNGLWQPAHYEVNGALFRRWLCKLHCNLRTFKSSVPAAYYVRTAFGEKANPFPRVFVWMNPGGYISSERRIWYAEYTIGFNNYEEHTLFHVYFMGLNFIVSPFDFSDDVKSALAKLTKSDFYSQYWMETPSKLICKLNNIQTKFLIFDWKGNNA